MLTKRHITSISFVRPSFSPSVDMFVDRRIFSVLTQFDVEGNILNKFQKESVILEEMR